MPLIPGYSSDFTVDATELMHVANAPKQLWTMCAHAVNHPIQLSLMYVN